jgi:hypothetical protein
MGNIANFDGKIRILSEKWSENGEKWIENGKKWIKNGEK